MTYYAWSTIHLSDGSKIDPGTEVNAKTLDIDKDEFQTYVDSGAVRTAKFPDIGNFDGSPVEFYRQQAADLVDNAMQEADKATGSEAVSTKGNATSS